jgi:hypothetical protein
MNRRDFRYPCSYPYRYHYRPAADRVPSWIRRLWAWF